MQTVVEWETLTTFTGRSGSAHCKGVEVMELDRGGVVITPLTSKGLIGKCDIEVPKSALPELINALRKCL